ncbi:MAG: LysR family transcriptional regulator [Moraxellaceae bacterium]|jgi:DNA-binding transcriptional LysR family regulator|nr:LysR family transcriptional regulator [Moraxellaceae bacterium]
MHRQALIRATNQQLLAFETTARLLSVTRAAAELNTSQPTVSIQLRELAESVGLPLFEQQGKRLVLTEAGRELQETVREIFACWSRFESHIAELQGVKRGTLRLAAVTTAEYLLPQLLGPFCDAFPGIEVELAVENRRTILQRLEQDMDDLTVIMVPPEDRRLRIEPFVDNPLVVIAAAGHRLAGKKCSLKQLQEERWLLREAGSGGRLIVEAHFSKESFTPRVAMALGSNEAIKHAVAGGLGITILSRHALEGSEGLVELDVRGFPLGGRFSFVMREGRRLSPAAQAFLQFAQQAVAMNYREKPGRRPARAKPPGRPAQ